MRQLTLIERYEVPMALLLGLLIGFTAAIISIHISSTMNDAMVKCLSNEQIPFQCRDMLSIMNSG